MDSLAAQFAINGQDDRARTQFRQYQATFRNNLAKEQKNVTLVEEGEQQLADRLTVSFARYLKQSETFYSMATPSSERRSEFYFNELLPSFIEIKNDADKVLEINQANMKAEGSRKAREAAAQSKRCDDRGAWRLRRRLRPHDRLRPESPRSSSRSVP